MSVACPGGKGTMNLSGLSGQSARAVALKARKSVRAMAATVSPFITPLSRFIIKSLQILSCRQLPNWHAAESTAFWSAPSAAGFAVFEKWLEDLNGLLQRFHR